MDTLLRNGDHVKNGCGLPQSIEGADELIQRMLLRLHIRKGSFSLDPQLGSNLHRMPVGEGEACDRLALGYAQEALAPTGASVLSAACTLSPSSPGRLSVRLEVRLDGQTLPLEVEIA